MKITNLQINGWKNPIGYDVSGTIHLSWEIQGKKDEATDWVRLEIYENRPDGKMVFDSEKLSAYREHAYDLARDWAARTRYYWRVAVAAGGCVIYSDWAYFETAKQQEAWQASWIAVEEESQAMPMLYRQLQIEKTVQKARLYALGLGLYETYIDEEKQGNEYLLPGYHSYDFHQQYQTYDVTDKLTIGTHTLAFILGEGWYKGRFVFEGGYTNLYGSRKKLIAELHVWFADGSQQVYGTDASWRAKTCEICENNIYDGEVQDMQQLQQELPVVVLNDTKALLCARINPPITVTETIPAHKLIHTPNDEWVLDFGEMVSGWVEFELAQDTAEIALYYGEELQEGCFYRENLRTAQAQFCVRNANRGYYRPHFTYYGFRYVKVEGIGKPEITRFVAKRLMSEIDCRGHIETGHQKVNQLMDNILRSQKCNFIDIPTDCPQRDERMGWTGDIGVYADTALFYMDAEAFLNHYLINLRKEQQALGGAVPFFVPRPKPAEHEGMNLFLRTAGVTTWGDAAVIVPWMMYEHTGDTSMLRRHYAMMCDWVAYIQARTQKNQTPGLWIGDRHLGDWLALDNGNPANPIGRTDPDFIASAYYYHSVCLCERAAHQLDMTTDEQRFHALAGEIKQAFLGKYLQENGELTIEPTQTAYALALQYELYREEQKGVLVEGLLRMLEQFDNHLSTGFVGTQFLCPALSENGYHQRACDLLLGEDAPGWLHEVNLGATTIWERWNSLDEHGKMSETGMNSLNHYAYGCIAGWMFRYLCGFRWDTDGRLVIRPMPEKRLGYVRGEIRGRYGVCKSSWRYEKEQLYVEIELPYGEQATLQLPDGSSRTLSAGQHTFVLSS